MDEQEFKVTIENAAYEMATLYYHLAKKIVERLGDEGQQLVRSAIRDWGAEKGRKQRENVTAMGLPCSLANLRVGSTLPWEPIMERETSLIDGVLHMKVHRCALADVWREHGALELAQLYCDEVDTAKWLAFDSRLIVERPQSKPSGDRVCEFVVSEQPDHSSE